MTIKRLRLGYFHSKFRVLEDSLEELKGSQSLEQKKKDIPSLLYFFVMALDLL
jgi:hypothetical protein